MMKYVFFFFLTFKIGFSQESYKITYKETDTRMNEKKNREYKGLLQEFENTRKKLNFILLCNKNNSFYYLQDIEIPDIDERNLAVASGSLSREGQYYYKDNKVSYKYNIIEGECFKVVETYEDELAWEITNETKQVLGYTCKKAIGDNGKYSVTAWFTTEIPYSYGPRSCYGLPGLVLEAETSADRTYAIKIEKNVKTKPPKKRKNCKEVTTEEFNKYIRRLMGME